MNFTINIIIKQFINFYAEYKPRQTISPSDLNSLGNFLKLPLYFAYNFPLIYLQWKEEIIFYIYLFRDTYIKSSNPIGH